MRCGDNPVRSYQGSPANVVTVFTERDLPWPRVWGCILTVHHACGLERPLTTTCNKSNIIKSFLTITSSKRGRINTTHLLRIFIFDKSLHSMPPILKDKTYQVRIICFMFSFFCKIVALRAVLVNSVHVYSVVIRCYTVVTPGGFGCT